MDIKSAAALYGNMAGVVQNNASSALEGKTESNQPSFADLISQSLSGAVDSGYNAEKVSTLALMGKADLTDLTTAVNAAAQALNTVVAIRDKIISAYQQISQMPM